MIEYLLLNFNTTVILLLFILQISSLSSKLKCDFIYNSSFDTDSYACVLSLIPITKKPDIFFLNSFTKAGKPNSW